MKHKGLIIIIGLLIFLVTIGSALAIKPADLEKKLEWKGENLSVYPINTEVDIPLDYIEFKDIKQSAKDNDLKFKNLGANTIGIDKKDIEHFRIKSSQAIYQVKDIRETHEWGYLGTGYGVDTITAKSDLIKDGNYICLINSKETFST